MAEKKLHTEIYVARESFYLGGNQLVLAGHTVVAGHPMLRGRKHMFTEFEPTWPMPEKKAEPTPEPEPEPAATVAAATTEPEPEPEPG